MFPCVSLVETPLVLALALGLRVLQEAFKRLTVLVIVIVVFMFMFVVHVFVPCVVFVLSLLVFVRRHRRRRHCRRRHCRG